MKLPARETRLGGWLLAGTAFACGAGRLLFDRLHRPPRDVRGDVALIALGLLLAAALIAWTLVELL